MRQCQICGKTKISGFNVSHSHRRTKRKWLPNLQKAKILIDKKSISMLVCTKCLKAQEKKVK